MFGLPFRSTKVTVVSPSSSRFPAVSVARFVIQAARPARSDVGLCDREELRDEANPKKLRSVIRSRGVAALPAMLISTARSMSQAMHAGYTAD